MRRQSVDNQHHHENEGSNVWLNFGHLKHLEPVHNTQQIKK